jgi:hypothetical protein
VDLLSNEEVDVLEAKEERNFRWIGPLINHTLSVSWIESIFNVVVEVIYM